MYTQQVPYQFYLLRFRNIYNSIVNECSLCKIRIIQVGMVTVTEA